MNAKSPTNSSRKRNFRSEKERERKSEKVKLFLSEKRRGKREKRRKQKEEKEKGVKRKTQRLETEGSPNAKLDLYFCFDKNDYLRSDDSSVVLFFLFSFFGFLTLTNSTSHYF